MLDYSPEKLRYFGWLASWRQRQDRAGKELMRLTSLQVAIASCLDKAGQSAFKSFQKQLLKEINDEPGQEIKERSKGIRKMLVTLGRMGVKESHGR